MTKQKQRILLRRVCAYILDVSLLFSILAPLGYLVQQWIGFSPTTAQEVYKTLFLNFSIPVWAYFTLADTSIRGATIGKRVFNLHTQNDENLRLSFSNALRRTAIKMIPWELTHISAFLLVPEIGQFSLISWLGIGTAYAISFAYLIAAWKTEGQKSIHDHLCKTAVSLVP